MQKTVFSLLTAFSCIALCLTPLKAAEETSTEQEEPEVSKFWQEHSNDFNLAVEVGASVKKLTDKSVELKSGTVLVESKGRLTVHMPMSTWTLKPHSMALMRTDKGIERVYCLLEAASAECEGHKIVLRMGEEALVTDHVPRYQEVTGEFEVGVRRQRPRDLNDKRHLDLMEFSIVQAMEREPLLSQISHSKHSHDLALRERLLKTAAAILLVTGKHGQYMGN